MSTKTTFKRIALVAVAALGLGVLSVVPSSAAVSGTTLTVNGAGAITLRSGSTTAADSDTNTAASFTVNALATSTWDTVTVQVFEKSKPAGATSPNLNITVADTSSARTAATFGALGDAISAIKLNSRANWAATADSTTVGGITGALGNLIRIVPITADGAGNIGATFSANIETKSAVAKGTYTYTVAVTSYSFTASDSTPTVSTTSADISVVVSANSEQAIAPVVTYSSAYIDASGTPSADAVVSAVATADATNDGVIYVTVKNAAQSTTNVQDSITATVSGVGIISFDGTTFGKSITYAATSGLNTIYIRGDGNAGVSTVTVTTKSGSSWTKSMSFYSKAAKTLTASVFTPVLAIGSNDSAVAVTAVDANGTSWTGAAYIVASSATDALVGGSATTPVACVLATDKSKFYCPVTTITPGTAKFKVIDASTVALATATSNEVTVTASNATAATVKIAFDKATYAPFEKAIITVTPLDASGNKIAASTSNLLAAALTSNVALTIAGGATATLPGASITTVAYDGTDKTAGTLSYVVYMPAASGTVTLTGKGGSALPLGGQVAVTASADVVNASVDAATDAANEATDAANAATDAALAAADAADAATAAAQDASDAVAALSATVAKLVASLKAQITSLTNLVIKIQKKVRA